MPINISWENDYYLRAAKINSKIARIFERQDVQQALAGHPDANGCSASVDASTERVNLIASVDVGTDPALAEIATTLDNEYYRVFEEVVPLDNKHVAVKIRVTGRAKIEKDDIELLRALGKVKTRSEEYISCTV
jgi:hypothetical protein